MLLSTLYKNFCVFIYLSFVSLNFCLFHCFLIQDPDQNLDAMQIIHSRGFGSEEHKVITRDGYILGMFRIINPFKNNYNSKPILLMHGIMVSCQDFLLNTHGLLDSYGHYIEQRYGNKIAYRELNGESVAVGGTLAFVLSQFGYDVWLGNFRANQYSSNHTYLNQKDSLYWSFSLDELIEFDMPAIIDYVVKYTNSEKIGVISHSMGSTVMLGLLSSKLEYNLIIDPLIALAPVVFNSHNKLWRQLSTFVTPILKSHSGTLIKRNKQIVSFTSNICQSKVLRYYCGLIIGLLMGYNFKQWDVSRFGTATGYSPDSLPNLVVAHYFQFASSGRFEKFDFGIDDNLLTYGQTLPPIYPLEKISANVALFYSYNDGYLNEIDMFRLRNKLKDTLIFDYLIPEPKWTHIDYFVGREAGFYSNSKIIDILRFTDHLTLNDVSYYDIMSNDLK